MLQEAARAVMLMDATKFGRKSLARVGSVDEVVQIITDDHISDRWRNQLGDRLVVAE